MRVRLGDVDDRLVGEDGRSVLLLGQLAVVVSPLATVILDELERAEAATGCALHVLVGALVATFGEPPAETSAVVVTEATCRELATSGAVQLLP